MAKLWDKGFEPDEMIERFTVGDDRQLDMRLARYDVEGSMAHIRMLEHIGLLTADELKTLLAGLEQIRSEIEEGRFEIEEGTEDVHSQVELLLTRRLGEVGKKIHAGRSRNDQVLVDLKLFLRDELRQTAHRVRTLFDRLQELSERYRDVLMPGYTHLQVAMPSSFGLWFGAYAETLVDDMRLLAAAYDVANQNPLGSAAGYGSSFPLDRTMTTRLLGFADLNYNVVAAQMSRGKSERAAAAAVAAVAATLGRFAMDVCLYMSQNFGFVSFPDELTTGSSIMPHKKNPDVFEIMRGKCNRLQGVPNEIALLVTNLPLGYHRDLQLLKDILFPATATLAECLAMCDFMLQHIRVRENILDDARYDYLFTVEDVNRLVLQGVPFREAYRRVGEQVQAGTYRPTREVRHTHEGSIGNLCTAQIRAKMERVRERGESGGVQSGRGSATSAMRIRRISNSEIRRILVYFRRRDPITAPPHASHVHRSQTSASSASTSSRIGTALWAPMRVTAIAEAAVAKRTASESGRPSESATASAPLKVSPAPVVSTASTLRAATRSQLSAPLTSAPSLPSVTTTCRTPRASNASAARSAPAASATGIPVSMAHSPRLGVSR